MDESSIHSDDKYIFNTWAQNGKSESMEINHKKTTSNSCNTYNWIKISHFWTLDVVTAGC